MIYNFLFPRKQRIYQLVTFGLSFFSLVKAETIPLSARPLSVVGNQIVTVDGKPVKIKGVSWFGFEGDISIPHGLWTDRHWKEMMDHIKATGFNTIRLPFNNEMFDPGVTAKSINQQSNPDLVGLTPLEIMDKIIHYADEIGLCIILDHHRSDIGIGAINDGLWYTDRYPESRFISDWVMLAQRYKNNPSVIGADIHNEPHGPATWGSGNQATDWKIAAEKVGNAILEVNPNILILIEGIESYNNQYYWWGGNLMGVKDHPVVLSNPKKLVYSPHDYPNSVYAQPWFSDPSYPNNLPTHFRNAWGYIFEQGIAPTLIGEFGSRFVDPKDIGWIEKLTGYMNGDFNGDGVSTLPANNQGMSFAYWCWNPNSSDTGGILLNDWKTVDQNKLTHIKPIMDGPTILDQVIDPNPQPQPDPDPEPQPEPEPEPQPIPILRAQYTVANGFPTNSQLKAGFIIHNDSATAIPLHEVTVRYWYTNEANKSQILWIDSADVGCCNIAGAFVSLSQPVSGANGYLELKFAVQAGNLQPGGNTGEILIHVNHLDGSNFVQSDDYSYDNTKTSFADWDHVTVYRNGQLIWGKEPTSAQEPMPDPGQSNVKITYSITNQWDDGFVASVKITNEGATPIDGWEVAFQFPNNQTITSIWNGKLVSTSGQIKIANVSYNNQIAMNGSVEFGFKGTHNGINQKPSSFLVNGVVAKT